MKLPRDVAEAELARALAKLDYRVTRQSGSHMRLTTERGGIRHITAPANSPLKVGTLAAILDDIADHANLTRGQLLDVPLG